MALRAVYSNSVGSNVDISSRIRAYQLSVSQFAEEGSTAITQLEVDDPEGGINILGLRLIQLTETAESSNQQVIGRWFTTERDIVRHESMRTGAARLWRVNMADPNSIIARRIMRGSDANRPAETDVQRVQWLLGTSEFGTTVTTSRYVSTLFPVAMDAVDYRDQSNLDIIDDCAQASGKNYFVFYDEPVAAYGLFYDYPGSSVFRSSIQLTNVLGFVDNDIIFGVLNDSTKLNRDPSRVYSGVLLPFVGGEVYTQNETTAAAFYRRDTTAPSVNVKTNAKASARASRYLTTIRTEADVITTAFVVPIAKVNHLQVGMAVQCWFSHFPGYETGWNWMRVMTRQVTAVSEENYIVEVELAAEVGGLPDGTGLVPAYPPVPIVAPTPPQSCIGTDGLTYQYTAAGTRGNLGLTFDFTDHVYKAVSTSFMGYQSAGGASHQFPFPGENGSFSGESVFNCGGTVGSTDWTCGGITPTAYFTLIGPGTLTILTATGGPGGNPNAPTMTGWMYRSGTSTQVDTQTVATGTVMTLVAPNDGFCGHFAVISGVGGQWGFTSATWSPA